MMPRMCRVADGHDEFVDRRVVRQREDVDRFDLLLVRILELLRDVDRRDVAGDGGLHIRVLERDRHELPLLLRPRPPPHRVGEQRSSAGRGVVTAGVWCLGRRLSMTRSSSSCEDPRSCGERALERWPEPPALGAGLLNSNPPPYRPISDVSETLPPPAVRCIRSAPPRATVTNQQPDRCGFHRRAPCLTLIVAGMDVASADAAT